MLNFLIFFVSLPNAWAFNETLHGRRIQMDTAWLFIEEAELGDKKIFYHQRECYKCLWSELEFEPSEETDTDNKSVLEAEIDMRWPMRFALTEKGVDRMEFDDDDNPIFTIEFMSFEEGGWYIFVTKSKEIQLWKSGRSPAVYLYPVYTLGMSCYYNTVFG